MIQKSNKKGITMRLLFATLLAILLLLGMVPFAVCNQGRCPTLADGSCDPTFTICGTIKRLGHCTTTVKHNGRKACACIAQ